MRKITKAERMVLMRIIGAAALLAVAHFAPVSGAVSAALYVAPYALIGWDVLWRAARNIARGSVFDENFLMSIATIGAFSIGEYAEAVFVMLFYQIGELFQRIAVNKSRASIAALMDIRPDYANREVAGTIEQVDPEEVAVGDVIVVKPGERVPLDGAVVEGYSALDTAALTGESAPRDVAPGDDVISGCVNATGVLRIRVTKPYGESTVARILELVETSSEKKARSETFITRFARYYTPGVVFAAVALAAIPPIFFGNFSEWLHRALLFLVISCPCALVISVPLSFFGGIGGASRKGILVKGANHLEALARTDTVVFDKTGTLTRGTFRVAAVNPAGALTDEELLSYAARAEQYSDHPISKSIRAAHEGALDLRGVSDAQELSGLGVCATVDGKRVCVGNARLMAREGAQFADAEAVGTIAHVAIDGAYAGHIVIADEIKPDAAAAIAALKAAGVKRVVMLTGDAHPVAAAVARAVGVDEFHAELLPEGKVARTEQLLSDARGKLAFVGDGINDAPVLTRADIGIAMGALGSDAAIEAADIVLMDDQLSKIAVAMRVSRKTLRIVKQNIAFALGIKFLALILGALGIATMWEAVFADVGVTFIAILNAMRALNAGEG